MAAQELEVQLLADTTNLKEGYAEIKKLEDERAAHAAELIEQTIALRKKELREAQKVTQELIKKQEVAGESLKEQYNKPIADSIKKTKELENAIKNLEPPTQKLTFAQEQLNNSIKRVQSTLRGFAITAAIAFGAAILKGVIDFAKGLFEASKATQAINAAMEEFVSQSGKALGSMREQFTELKKLTPGTLAWKNEIEKVNKQYGDMIKLDVTSTLSDIEEAEKLLTNAITEQIREETRREALRKAFADAESARIQLQLAEQGGAADIVIRSLRIIADEAEKTAKAVEKGLEPTEFARQEQARADARQAELEAEKKFQDQATEAEKKAAEIKKQNAQKAADEIEANFEQAAKAIQALEDEIEKTEIENIEDKTDRAIALADFEFKIAKRNAEDTIINKQQLDTFIEGLETQHQQTIAKIKLDQQTAVEEEERQRIIEGRRTLHESIATLDERARQDFIDGVKRTIEERKLLDENEAEVERERAERRQKIVDDLNETASAFGTAASSFSDLYNQLTAKDRAFAEAEIERINKTIEGEEAREKAILNVERNLARETEKFAVFAKTAALFEILASQATTIANIVQMAANVGAASGPAGPVTFAITLAAGLAATIANFAAAKSILDGAPLPKFAEGTSATQKGWAVVGERGPEIIKTNKGDAVFNNKAVRTERELIDAINDGTINDLIMRQYVYPAIMAHQVAQKARDKQELKETVSAYFDNAFDDTNLQRIGDRQIGILKVIAARLKPKATPAPRSRF